MQPIRLLREATHFRKVRGPDGGGCGGLSAGGRAAGGAWGGMYVKIALAGLGQGWMSRDGLWVQGAGYNGKLCPGALMARRCVGLDGGGGPVGRARAGAGTTSTAGAGPGRSWVRVAH